MHTRPHALTAVSFGAKRLGFWSTNGWFLAAILISLAATMIVTLGGVAVARVVGLRSPKEILVYTATIQLYVFFVLIITW
jgi:hypothetical protein